MSQHNTWKYISMWAFLNIMDTILLDELSFAPCAIVYQVSLTSYIANMTWRTIEKIVALIWLTVVWWLYWLKYGDN